MEFIHTMGPVEGKLVYRTVIRETGNGTVQEAVYRTPTDNRVIKYWACARGQSLAKEFDTECMALSYMRAIE